jgi:hypothetical protein
MIPFFNTCCQIPDITSDIEEQLTGQDTYRRKLAMSKHVRSTAEHTSNQQSSKLVESLGPANQESDALQALPKV